MIESSRRIGESTSGWKSSATCMGICAEVMNQPTAVAVGHDQHDDGGGACRAGAHGEQALEIADMLVRSGAVDLVVIDSVAALIPQTELEARWAKRRSAGTPA